jgi:hypothetical protein
MVSTLGVLKRFFQKFRSSARTQKFFSQSQGNLFFHQTA